MTSPPAATRRWPWYLAAILLLLTVVGGAATLLLDRYLTSLAREQASRLATAWQRPVEIGAVRTAFLTGLGVRVEGVRIGPGAGETRSLLELDRAEVRLDLPRAVRTGGRELSIRSAELRGLRVVVVRARDGSTNLARLAEAMSRGAPPGPAAAAPPVTPPGPGAAGPEPVDRSRFRIEHAAVVGARLTLVDEGAGGPELAVDRIDLTVDGLAAGAPLELILRAGLLSTTQNLLLKLHAPALPASLVPTPDRLTIRLTPVDLTPLAPFAPRGAGFLGGRVTADLDVALGGAMPGGQGLTTVRGGFAATGLRFVGQEGGKALDVTLDVDLTGDAERGDLAIGKLLLAFGPATLEGKGKVTGLRSDRPALEGLRLTASHLDPAALAAWYPPLPRLIGGTVAGPVGLSLEAEGTAAQPVLRLRADLTPVRLAFAGLLEKAAGGPLVLAARLRPGERGALGFEVEADLTGLDLRPGGTLAKRPGDRFTLAVVGSRRAAGETQTLELTSLAASLLETNLKGHGKLELAPGTRRFDLDLAIDRVDADRLLAPTPPPGAVAKPGVAGPGAGRGARCPVALRRAGGAADAPGRRRVGAEAEAHRPARHGGGEGGRDHAPGGAPGGLAGTAGPLRLQRPPRPGRPSIHRACTRRRGPGRPGALHAG